MRLGLGLSPCTSKLIPAYSPLDIPNLAAWYDAADTSTITHSGGSVSQWNDKSGNGNHLTSTSVGRPTTNTRTLNSKNVLDFDGTSDYLAAPAGLLSVPSGDNTVIACFASDNTGDATQRILNYNNTTPAVRATLAFDTNNIIAMNRSSSNAPTTQALARSTTTRIIGYRRSGTTITPFYDGILGTSGTNSENFTATTAYIGSANTGVTERLNGVLAELIICKANLSDADLDQIGDYLEDKWSATWTNLLAPASALYYDDAMTELYYVDDAATELYLTE